MLRTLLTLVFLLAAAPAAALAGVTSIGSSVLEPFLKQWAARSGGDINISSPGTSTAPKALISGKADLAAMNREMTNDESEAFIRVHGYYPTAIAVGIEAVAVYVHPGNPLKGLDYRQLDSLYSASHGCGWHERITTWGQLGLPAPWDKQSIVLLGHDNKSPVRDFFSNTVLCRDDFKPGIEELSHEQLLARVAQNKDALGYGRYQANSGLKIVPLKKGAGDFVPLTVANLYNKSYRLQHFLFLYIDRPNGKPVSPEVMAFLKTGLSREGQAAVAEAGYVPLSDDLIQRQLNKLK
ncbi:MAG: substrate-binding domain-containing protein [Sulfuricella sp.]|jgi:phosphate transport system substrate-binding protein|nr:substrate-binding domain-containing protein [Sulfuricella sp.]